MRDGTSDEASLGLKAYEGRTTMRNDTGGGAPIFSEHMPVQAIERGPDQVVLETAFTAHHLNAAGTVHGGVLAALLDMAVTGAAKASVNNGIGAFGVTMSMTINFICAAGPGRARCESRILGGGRRTKFVDARIADAGGELVATATATVRVVDLKS